MLATKDTDRIHAAVIARWVAARFFPGSKEHADCARAAYRWAVTGQRAPMAVLMQSWSLDRKRYPGQPGLEYAAHAIFASLHHEPRKSTLTAAQIAESARRNPRGFGGTPELDAMVETLNARLARDPHRL